MCADQTYSQWKQDAFVALGAGAAAAVIMGLGAFIVGRVSGSEARQLLEAILPTSRFLCSAVMTATATILALMLTMLGMSFNADVKIRPVFYQRIKQIAFYDMIALVVAACFLVVHCIPIVKSDDVDFQWYTVVYYCVLVVAAVLGGGIVTIISMLYAAIRDIIHALALDDDHALTDSNDAQAGPSDT